MVLTEKIQDALAKIVGSDHIKTDAESLTYFGRDTCDMIEPRPSFIVFPANTKEVRQIVLLANECSLALVPSGGRTGLSGGATASNGEVVVSMGRMNRILEHSVTDRSVRCQAGVELARLQQQAVDMGLYYPVDYASSGSSHIAGSIATNGGGNRVIRYGMTRNWVAGMEVVTGTGEVLQLGHDLVKDNTGYDLKQLFIGSEGTLGFITEATMRLDRAPKDSSVMVLGLESLAQLLPVLQSFQASVVINAFEFFTEDTLRKVIAKHGLSRPFETESPVYALIEFEAGSNVEIQSALHVFESCSEQGWVTDGVMSQNERQAADLWRLREDISETLAQWNPYKNDLSVRVSLVPEFLEEIVEVVNERYPDFEVLWYGHIGDGNIHLNILKPDHLTVEEFKARCGPVSEEIFSITQKLGGSISAEHGIGLLKKSYLSHTRSEQEIQLMWEIKKVFDPNGVMNPGKILD